MSVIYATLERLETEHEATSGQEHEDISSRLNSGAGGLPVKVLATAMMVVLAGASLMLWQGGDQRGVAEQLSPSAAASQYVAARKSERRRTTESVGAPASAARESVEPIIEAPTSGEAAATAPAPADAVGAPPEQGSAVAEKPAERESVQPGAEMAQVKADTVSPDVAHPVAVPAEPVEQKRLASIETGWLHEVEEAIEQARLAMSRGRYYQALSTLDQLEPLPENRADLWLIKGSAHLGIGQLEQAEAAFDSAQALAPDNAQIAVQRAILKQEQGDHAAALQILNGAAMHHPDVPEIYLNKGYSEQALGAVRAAQRSFRTFLQMTENRSLYVQQRKAVKDWLAQVSAFQS